MTIPAPGTVNIGIVETVLDVTLGAFSSATWTNEGVTPVCLMGVALSATNIAPLGGCSINSDGGNPIAEVLLGGDSAVNNAFALITGFNGLTILSGGSITANTFGGATGSCVLWVVAQRNGYPPGAGAAYAQTVGLSI